MFTSPYYSCHCNMDINLKDMDEHTLEEKLTAIFNSGYSIVFQNTVKRKDGEWHSRIIWKHVGLPGNRHIKDCDWWGFDTIGEAVEDCLTYIVLKNVEA